VIQFMFVFHIFYISKLDEGIPFTGSPLSLSFLMLFKELILRLSLQTVERLAYFLSKNDRSYMELPYLTFLNTTSYLAKVC
jgi:hypothetical protein